MKPARLYFTLKDLSWQQFWYRIWYPFKRKGYTTASIPESTIAAALAWSQRALFELPVFDHYDPQQQAFILLNIRQDFPEAIDWNSTRHGMLWAYHLNYFGWLEDETISVEARTATIKQYCIDSRTLRIGLDAYPISLRGMAMIRFLLKHRVADREMLGLIYKHYHRLYYFPEYHLQANHLWQNACSLICAGLYFKDDAFYNKGRKILLKELEKQILPDGGHIEGSPMYHAALLAALLQTIELSNRLNSDNQEFLEQLISAAALMLGWLEQITFGNGDWPQVNDSTGGMVSDLAFLKNYAMTMGILPRKKPLQQSGYRMFRRGTYELFVDGGAIQPIWQPGHAHSDELSICLNVNDQPIIVDPAISTYESGESRNIQRSTQAHNTICINNRNASDVWKSFRAGKKAKVNILEEGENNLLIECIANQYVYRRNIALNSEYLIITDTVIKGQLEDVSIYFHFAKDIILKKINNSEFLAGNLRINIEGNIGAEIETYYLSEEFNQQIPALKLHIQTGKHTITRLQILNAN